MNYPLIIQIYHVISFHHVIVLPYLTSQIQVWQEPRLLFMTKHVVPERAQPRLPGHPSAPPAPADGETCRAGCTTCARKWLTVGVNGLGSGGDICLMNSPSGNCINGEDEILNHWTWRDPIFRETKPVNDPWLFNCLRWRWCSVLLDNFHRLHGRFQHESYCTQQVFIGIYVPVFWGNMFFLKSSPQIKLKLHMLYIRISYISCNS